MPVPAVRRPAPASSLRPFFTFLLFFYRTPFSYRTDRTMSVTKSRRRRSLLAFGAATAGLASALVPSGAQAASDPTSPQSDVQRKEGVRYVAEPVAAGSPAEARSPSSALAATCTDFRTFLAPGGVIHVPSTSAGSLNCVLGQGNTGAGVKQLQRTINFCYTAIDMDANFGPQTANGVRVIQRTEGVAVDGVWGPQTRSVTFFAVFNGNDDFTGLCANPAAF
jgi:hypothetical protein